jgi:transposase
MSISGVGPLISTGVVAAIGAGDAFERGRDFGAWLGLVPRQFNPQSSLAKLRRRLIARKGPFGLKTADCGNRALAGFGGKPDDGRPAKGAPPIADMLNDKMGNAGSGPCPLTD